MDFTPKTWLTGDVITAAELNRIETGVEDAELAIDALEVKSPIITLAGDLTGSVTLTNLGNGTLTATILDDSHAHVISNVDGLQAALDGKASTGTTITAGTGLSGGGSLAANRTISVAALGIGTTQLADSSVTASKIGPSAVTDAKVSTGINAAKIANGTVSNTEFQYLNGVTSAVQTQLNGKLSTSGKAADSNLLDGIDSSAFLRSNASDSHTSGTLTVPDLSLGSPTAGSYDRVANGPTVTLPRGFYIFGWENVNDGLRWRYEPAVEVTWDGGTTWKSIGSWGFVYSDGGNARVIWTEYDIGVDVSDSREFRYERF